MTKPEPQAGASQEETMALRRELKRVIVTFNETWKGQKH